MPPLGEIETNAAACLASMAAHEQLPVGEASTALCLDRFLGARAARPRAVVELAPDSFRPGEGRLEGNDGWFDAASGQHLGPDEAADAGREFIAGLARTAAIYQVPDSAAEVFATLPPKEAGLPPLPFPRMWFDCIDEAGRLVPFLLLTPSSLPEVETTFGAEGLGVRWFAVAEQEVGGPWDVMIGWSRLKVNGAGEGAIGLWRLTPSPDGDGVWAAEGSGFGPTTAERDEVEAGAAALVRGCLLNAVHLVTARRVRHRPLGMPRSQRKALGRRGMAMPPHLYRVDLSEAGEVRRGVSDREYHVRWLVQGHWRRHEGGTYVPSKGGPCTWVRPYVKGPPDAPWKGRPVYTGVAAS